MKIALLAPPWLPIPPNGYGGIENVIYNLTEGLHQKGHQVVLFATGDSHTSAQLLYHYPNALGVDMLTHKSHMLFYLNQVYEALKQFPKDIDLIHNHCEYAALHLLSNYSKPSIHTLHGSFYQSKGQDQSISAASYLAYQDTFSLFKNQPYISISNFQRGGRSDLNYIATVYNGINLQSIPFVQKPQDYLSWVARFTPIKGLDIAIKVAKQTQKQLQFAPQIIKSFQHIYHKEITPQIDNTTIIEKKQWTNPQDKYAFYGHSKAFLFPIQWEEPFGLVIVEAMATGTPVITFARGAMTEIVNDGENGLLVNPADNDIRGSFITKKTGFEGLCEAIEYLYTLPESKYQEMRQKARQRVEQNFTVEKMVDNYIQAYEEILG